ncbi:MAG: hypothetical protein AAF747_09040, partial [Planctomycetota bacterium]
RTADGAALERANAAASVQVWRIRDLEAYRSELLLPYRKGATLAEVAQSFDESSRERVLGLAADLRDRVEQARRQTGVVGRVSSSLMMHLQGVLQQVQRRLSHAGTYSTRARVEAGPAVVSAIDVTS